MTQHRQAAWIVAAFCTVFVPPGFAQSIVWTGAGAGNNWTDGANWQGGAAPTTGADVTTGSMRRYGINLDASASVNSLTIDDKYHEFDTANESTLTIGSGGLSKVNNGDEARFNSSLTINLGASQTWYIAGDPYYSDDNPVRVNGSITGTGIDFVKTGSGRLILNGNNSSLSGSFILSGGYLQLGHDNALGTTTLNINADSTIESTNGDRSFANAIVLNTGYVYLQTDEGRMTFSGPVTLGTSSTVVVQGANPVVVSGNLSEAVSGQTLTKSGAGTLVLQGTIGTTGGASVNQGRLILDSSAAIPASANAITVSYSGYVGTTVSTFSPDVQTGFLGKFTSGSNGAIGFDTNNLAAPNTVTDSIDLTSYANLHLGSSTAATLQGTITPAGDTYRFGGGGGLLRVESNLTANPTTSVSRNIIVESPSGQALSLVLAGNNNYENVTIDNSVVRFASSPAFRPAGFFLINSQGYVGFDYDLDLSTLSSQLTVSPYSNLVVGFDASTPRTVTTSIDLSAFPADTAYARYTYLGTSSDLTVSGTITPAGAATEPWRFAAVKDGHLTVASTLAGSRGVVVNLWNDYYGDYDKSSGQFTGPTSTVTLTGNNTYTGGTTLQGGRLELGSATALGTGTLTVNNSTLATTTAGLTIANPIVNQTNGDDDGFHLDGSNSFTLSGDITGRGTLYKEGAGTVTLTGAVDLPNYTSEITYLSNVRVRQGTLAVAGPFTIGGELVLADDTTVDFGPSVAATVGELKTKDSPYGNGVINLGAGSTLTIDQTSGSDDPYFSGTINGSGSLVKAGSGNQYLGTLPGPSASNYSGGTTVTGGAILDLSNGALGTGPVTINAGTPKTSGVALYTGVTLTNSLTFTSGTLAGFGTFSPANGTVIVGANRFVSPGNLFDHDPIGALGFGNGLTFASDGTYVWEISDATGSAGLNWDKLLITGTLALTATPAAPFILDIGSVGLGVNNFDNSQGYSWVIASATGGITGFDPNAITLDTTGFSNSLGTGYFLLTQSGNDLVLDFIPEPSTSALLGLGLVGLLIGWWRQRRG